MRGNRAERMILLGGLLPLEILIIAHVVRLAWPRVVELVW